MNIHFLVIPNSKIFYLAEIQVQRNVKVQVFLNPNPYQVNRETL